MAKKEPEQIGIPGVEDPEIKSLNEAVWDYAKIRDRRIKLNAQEHDLKEKLLELMHKHDRETYTWRDITIVVIKEDETLKVKVAREKDDKDDE